MITGTPRRLTAVAAIALLPTMLVLGAAEIIVRWTGAAERCPGYKDSILWVCDPILYFKPNPGQVIHGQPLNSRGFRSREFAPKRPGVVRILSLGDSCTFGLISPGDAQPLEYVREPYPQRLDRISAERGAAPAIEVMNAAVPGYNAYQGLMLLRTKLRGLAPDLITVRFGWNDHFMSPEQHIGDAFREPPFAAAIWGQDLLLRTALFPFAKRLGMELAVRVSQPSSAGALEVPVAWRPNIPVDEYEHHLRRIIEVARNWGAAVWLLTAPHAFLMNEHRGRAEHFGPQSSAGQMLVRNGHPSFEHLVEAHESYNAATRRVAAQLTAPLVDLEAVYRAHEGEHLFENGDFLHPNQAGHDLEAATLYQRLVEAAFVRSAR